MTKTTGHKEDVVNNPSHYRGSKGQPKTEMSKFINAYKSASSRLLKKEFPIIRQKLWKEMFWSQSFCLLSSGGAPIEVIKEYIENQGQKK